MKRNLYVIDLFAGCGGSARGFRDAGFEIKVAVDIDKMATETFKTNFPEATVFNSDINYVTGNEILKQAGLRTGSETVVIACPPCQGFSSARRNSQRKTDPRNMLIEEFVRLLEEIRPFAFVMENVPGLARGIGKYIFTQTLTKIHSLGYFTVHGIVDAADYGVPQKRKRLVLIGTNAPDIRIKFPLSTNQNPENENNTLKPWITVRDTIADLPRIKAGEKNPADQLHASASLSETNLKRMAKTPHNGGSRDSWPDELILECHKRVNGYKDIYGRMRWDTPSPTMTGGCAMISKGRFGHPEQNRSISLREAARLQTFPDGFMFRGNFGEIAKQIGNAVPPRLAQIIAVSLLEDIRNSEDERKILTEPVNQTYYGAYQ